MPICHRSSDDHRRHRAAGRLVRSSQCRNRSARRAVLAVGESRRQQGQIPSSISNSSCGVQITGGSNPLSRQMRSMRGRIEGFAMCLQFQVNRYSTPLTAAMEMCNASIAAFSGNGTPERRESANAMRDDKGPGVFDVANRRHTNKDSRRLIPSPEKP